MSDCEIVEVEGWEATLMEFNIWRKTYMHLWDHIEEGICFDTRITCGFLDAVMDH